MDIIKVIEQEQLKSDVPEIRVGDTVKVHIRIKEGAKERKKGSVKTAARRGANVVA